MDVSVQKGFGLELRITAAMTAICEPNCSCAQPDYIRFNLTSKNGKKVGRFGKDKERDEVGMGGTGKRGNDRGRREKNGKFNASVP